jgi:hypothetical protein
MLKLIRLAFGIAIFCVGPCPGQIKEEEAIINVLQESYVKGVFNEGNRALVQEGFAAAFTMFSLTADGTVKTITKADWLRRVQENKAKGRYPAKEENKVRIVIKKVEVADTAAMVKLHFYRGEHLRYVDFIGLYRFKTGWKIISKTFTSVH